ncbi:MAG: hypothetical protein IPO41_13675 [Acidobacteria bacterium]|nr:hypothetical protein [Acidobacteriota bacterium]
MKDQALKERRSVTNALGQLIRVDEPTTAGLGAIDTPNQPTYYVYDTLNNLTTVKQGGTFASPVQTRSFVYDSLARLKSATNPESGQIQYTYDNNGNLATKTDARSISTTYTYDNLNRVTFRNYSETTPDVSYFYDNLTNAKGKLKKVSSSVSTTEYTAFDILGRVTAHKQTTDGVDYTTGYTYNLGGALIEETYPSGRVVKNVVDNSGDLSAVQSKKNANSGYWSYADSLSYNAAGAVTSMQLGNGRWESTVFNKRFQPEQIALGTTPGATDKLKLDYTYGMTNNNGNVLTQTITVPGMTYPLVQNYTYDALNRLDDANETSNGTQTWRQDFTYDRYGNRNFIQANTTMPSSFANPAVSNPAISTADNRITSTGFLYDSAGNTTRDASYQTFTYDAENKQSEVKNSSSVSLGQYSYDGDGKRVKKYVPASGETTVFVYDAAGKQIAEYSTLVESSTTAKVAYLTSDHLGSPRINSDQNGAVISRHDYHPFGEEIDGTGGRTTGVDYGDDTVRKQFTGYERDDESGWDYAQARMYSSNLGRFGQCDPIIVSKDHPPNPQRWNAYIYVLNAPTVATDPDGRKPKRVIDVFITLKPNETNASQWKVIQQYGKKHGATVNVYTTEAGTATVEEFKKSIQTKDRTVVFIGHSFVPGTDNVAAREGRGSVAGKGEGIEFADGAIASPSAQKKGSMVGADTLEGTEASAKNLVVLSCDFGDTFAPLGSNSNTNFLWATGGEDGLTASIATVVKVGKKMVEIFARGGSARQAQAAGGAIIDLHPGNDGETMIRERLSPMELPED